VYNMIMSGLNFILLIRAYNGISGLLRTFQPKEVLDIFD